MDFEAPLSTLFPGPSSAVLSVLLRTQAPLSGRQVHGLLADRYSLRPVQEALRALADAGVVTRQQVGRSIVHTITEDHYAVAPLRRLTDPVGVLRDVVAEWSTASTAVESVLLFGSTARGEAQTGSDLDLAVILRGDQTDHDNDLAASLGDLVSRRFGNACDVLVLSRAQYDELLDEGEAVVRDIDRDGVALLGTRPRRRLSGRSAT